MNLLDGMARRSLSLAAAVAMVVGLAACSSSSGASSSQSTESAAPPTSGSPTNGGGGHESMTIATVPTDSCAQSFIGKEKGFFADSGLDVNIKIVGGVPQLASAVSSGQAQIACTTTVAIASAYLHGIHFKIVAPGTVYTKQNPGTYLMVADSANIKSVKELSGKTIGVPYLPQLGLKATLAAGGADLSSVKFVTLPFTDVGAALQSGRVTAAIAVSPYVEQIEQSKVANKLVAVYTAVNNGNDFATTAWFAKSDYVANNNAAVAKFETAIKNISKWANDSANAAERRSILSKVTGTKLSVLNETELDVYGTAVTTEGIQAVIDVLARYDEIKKSFKAQEIIGTAS